MILRISLLLGSAFVLLSPMFAQKWSQKKTKIEVVEFPTVPAEQVSRIAFNLFAEDHYFNLEDLRRYGGNMDLLKSSGERISGMKYFTLGSKAEVVDVGPSIMVDVAIGPEKQGIPMVSSEMVKSSRWRGENLLGERALPIAHADQDCISRGRGVGCI